MSDKPKTSLKNVDDIIPPVRRIWTASFEGVKALKLSGFEKG